MKNTLTVLRDRDYKLSIGSSSKNTKFILGQIGLGGFFDAIVDGTGITHSKPDPEAAKAGGMTALALFGDATGCGLEDYDLTFFSDLLNILP